MKRIFAVVAIAISAVMITPQTAAAETLMKSDFYPGGRPTSKALSTTKCRATSNIWQQELGQSGITRLRSKFELRGIYDNGIPGLSYAGTGWMYSKSFPDDARSFYKGYTPGFNFAVNKRFQMRAVMIGERPSFWKPDVKVKFGMGEVGCDVASAVGGISSASA